MSINCISNSQKPTALKSCTDNNIIPFMLNLNVQYTWSRYIHKVPIYVPIFINFDKQIQLALNDYIFYFCTNVIDNYYNINVQCTRHKGITQQQRKWDCKKKVK